MSDSLGLVYRRLLSATALSAVGTGMTTAALPLVAAVEPNSELVLGAIAAAGLLPGVLLAVPAGLLADRYDRGRVMVMADVTRAVVVSIAAIAVAFGRLPGLALAAITFMVGAGETIFITASQSAVPSFIATHRLDEANGHLQLAEDSGREFIGPPMGSLVFRIGNWIPFVTDAVSYIVSAVLLLRLPRASLHAKGSARPHTTMAPAWNFFRRSRPLVVLSAAMLTLSMCGSAVLAMLVLLVREQFSLDVGWFGVSLTVIACGAAVAGLFAGRIRARVPARWVMSAAIAMNAAAYLVLGITRMWPVALAALLSWGFAVTLGNITSVGIRQRLIPAELIGRVMGIFRAALGAGGVIGALASGVVARATSVGTVATVAGLVQLPVVLAVAIGLPRGAGDAVHGESPARTS